MASAIERTERKPKTEAERLAAAEAYMQNAAASLQSMLYAALTEMRQQVADVKPTYSSIVELSEMLAAIEKWLPASHSGKSER